MSQAESRAERRAKRFLLIYPKAWRDRYGAEFTELLLAEFEDEPQSWRRTFNVVIAGARTRLLPTGLVGQPLPPIEQGRANLVSLGCALAAFLTFGIALWARLTVGWQWSRPSTSITSVAMVVMTATVLAFCLLGLLAGLPVAWCLVRRCVEGQIRELIRPILVCATGLAVVVIGGRHFGNGWPGTGGHPWAHQGIVPGGVAAFTWASTLSISSYWGHPTSLLSFPPAEVAWMAVSPLAIVGMVGGAAATVSHLDLSAKIIRFEARVGSLATMAMLTFLTGCCFWIIDGGPGPRDLFHRGAVNAVEVVAMTLALLIGRLAVHRLPKPHLLPLD